MKVDITEEIRRKFQQKIFFWWEKNKRDFPWRETEDPYCILVSEVMLQQTQAPRVISKYKEFIKSFPNIESLATAQLSEVLSHWSGLGYNRRALWLQEAAKEIAKLDKFPTTKEELIKLKGIGNYSARSILIFAFNQNLVTVDTNIRRILIAEGFAEETTTEKELLEIAEKFLPVGKSKDWHNALMDYGSEVLTVSRTGIKSTSKQPKFKDSDREFRGKILKTVLEEKTVSIKRIKKELQISEKRLENIVEKMQKDNLIIREGDKIFID